MRDGAYIKRLNADLERWRIAGTIQPDQAEAMLTDARSRTGQGVSNPAAVAAALGAVLFGLGVITFVAANWGGMAKSARMLSALLLVWLTYGGAVFAFERKANWLGHSLALAGALAVGAAISMVGQTYHIEGTPAGLLLLWSLLSILAAIVFQSKPILILYVILAFLYYALERPGFAWFGDMRDHTQSIALFGPLYLPLWFAGAALGRRWDSGAAMHLSGLGLMLWVVLLFTDSIWPAEGDREWVTSGLLVAAFGAAQAGIGEFFRKRDERAGAIALAWGAATVFSGALIAQLSLWDDKNLAINMSVAALIIALSVWAIGWGDTHGRKAVRGFAVAAFAFECFYVYASLFEGLMGSALFLLGAGVLLFALAFLLRRITRKPTPKAEPTS